MRNGDGGGGSGHTIPGILPIGGGNINISAVPNKSRTQNKMTLFNMAHFDPSDPDRL